jgi:hypothetical protein
MDVERHKEWIYKDKITKVLQQVSDNEVIYYAEVSAPWPAKNRDLIARTKATQTAPNTVTIVMSPENGYLPEKEGIVRAKNFSSTWTLTALGDGRVKAEYILHMDPGGAAPAGLVNMFITRGPYDTFMRLREMVNKPEYQNVHLSYIQE